MQALKADASQSSFSQAMTTSQKTLFIQSVYLASLIRFMLTSHSLLDSESFEKKQEQEAMQANLMSKLT